MALSKHDKKRRYCPGCRNDFYNGKNSIGVSECWSLQESKVVFRKEVPIDQPPPWNQKARRFLSCYHRPGFVYVAPKQTY